MQGMNNMQLKPILLDKFWLILSDTNEKIGALSFKDATFSVIANGSVAKVGSKEELLEAFGIDLFQNVVATEDKSESITYISGYPAFVANAVAVEPKEAELKDIPVFVKSKESTVMFAAGYYCIKFPKLTMPATTPKVQTLVKYGFLGPYKTQQEMNFHLQKARAAKSA